jgi:hypothetical protein
MNRALWRRAEVGRGCVGVGAGQIPAAKFPWPSGYMPRRGRRRHRVQARPIFVGTGQVVYRQVSMGWKRSRGGRKHGYVHRTFATETAWKFVLGMTNRYCRDTCSRRPGLYRRSIIAMTGMTKCRGVGLLESGQEKANQDQQSRNHSPEPVRRAFRHRLVTSSCDRSSQPAAGSTGYPDANASATQCDTGPQVFPLRPYAAPHGPH